LSGDRQRGFSLVSALFLLVVVSAATAGMVGLVSVEQRSVSLGVMGARALYAARSGVEWATARAVADPTACPAGTLALTEGALAGFSVTVTCARSVHDENGTSWNTLRLRSAASRGAFGSGDYVFRRIESTVSVAAP
jgi:MSHA biogenesis protein MshP